MIHKSNNIFQQTNLTQGLEQNKYNNLNNLTSNTQYYSTNNKNNKTNKKKAELILSIIALMTAFLSSGISIWNLITASEKSLSTQIPSSDIIIGIGIERVAKLEKEINQLTSRLLTLEKELTSLAGKDGSVNKLTELNSKITALQTRIETVNSNKINISKDIDEEISQPIPKVNINNPTNSEKNLNKISQAVAMVAKAHADSEEHEDKKEKYIHNVHQGDTLLSIATHYKITREEIIRWNNMKTDDNIKIGQQLIIYK